MQSASSVCGLAAVEKKKKAVKDIKNTKAQMETKYVLLIVGVLLLLFSISGERAESTTPVQQAEQAGQAEFAPAVPSSFTGFRSSVQRGYPPPRTAARALGNALGSVINGTVSKAVGSGYATGTRTDTRLQSRGPKTPRPPLHPTNAEIASGKYNPQTVRNGRT